MRIDLKQVSVCYAQSGTVLNNLDLQINSGEFIGITGKAGTGKTTLIDVIGGLHKPDNGSVYFDGCDIYQKSFDHLNFRRKLQIVFQFPENQFFETDIEREISFGLKMLKIPEQEIGTRVQNVLESVGLNDESVLELSPFALSGGQKRRLALACVIAVQPEIILLDEPFSGLDAKGVQQLSEALKTMHQQGMTIVMVSHDPDTLCEICSRILVLDEGKIVIDGSPEIVFADENICAQLGIGQPETKIMYDKLKISSPSDLSYTTFIQEIENRIRYKKK